MPVVFMLVFFCGCVTEYIEEVPNYNINRTLKPGSTTSHYDTSGLEIGMTKEDIKGKWGLPTQIAVSATDSQSYEQWEYCNSYSSKTGDCESFKYLYFDNEKLTSWKE